MKIAVATDGNMVSAHFGHCPEYSIFNVEDNRISSKVVIPNPGHEPGFLPEYLSKIGVSCIIAGGMGPRAQQLFEEKNVQVVTGAEGPVDGVVRQFISGELKTGESRCHHTETDHNCGDHDKG